MFKTFSQKVFLMAIPGRLLFCLFVVLILGHLTFATAQSPQVPAVADTSVATSKTDTSTVLADTIPETTDSIASYSDSIAVDSIEMDSLTTEPENVLEGLDLDVDTSRIQLFLRGGIQFVDFAKRELFDADLQRRQQRLLSQAEDFEDSLRVRTEVQNYQKVNFAFPLGAGVSWQFLPRHYAGVSLSFFHDYENAILTDRNGNHLELYYALQGVPLNLEYRYRIPTAIAELTNAKEFSLLLRRTWMLPGTEIYSSSGVVEARPSTFGHGWGIYLGYRAFKWRNIIIFGDLGYSSVSVSADGQWNDLIAGSADSSSVSWNTGGLSLNLSLMVKLFPREMSEDERNKVLQAYAPQQRPGSEPRLSPVESDDGTAPVRSGNTQSTDDKGSSSTEEEKQQKIQDMKEKLLRLREQK